VEAAAAVASAALVAEVLVVEEPQAVGSLFMNFYKI
jgi:hypothetical protein